MVGLGRLSADQRQVNKEMMNHDQELVSCDTFVVMSDASENGEVIFGKNSDRPNGEVQEVVFVPGNEHAKGTKLKVMLKK